MTLQQIDAICDEFEAALRRGDTVRFDDDILLKVEEPQRPALQRELLQICIQYAFESQKSEEYLRNLQETLNRQFPDHRNLIQSLFQQANQLRQIGDYEILGELGRGGMGTVYKAKHKFLQQTVAIKVLSEALLDDSQAVGRFRREMQLIGGLTHPNIVRALNAGEADGVHYLAMEYVDGITLQKLVESVRIRAENGSARAGDTSPPVPPESPAYLRLPLISLGAACEMIRQAALGLQNAHELKLVHRDIKPANLMLDHRGTVKILDLGLGKFAEENRQDYHSSLTMAGMVIGTVDYISPEQCENSGTADVRSDLYSLGCSLYFLLTGKPVYSGSRYDTMRKKLMGHIVGDVPSLRRELPDLPLAIEAILQKILSKDPEDRFQTPLEFAEALEPFASLDELWTLMQEVLPMDASDSRSSMRHSSPYGYVQSSRQSIISQPVNRTKWIACFVALNLLVLGIGIGVAFYFADSQNLQKEAERTEENARRLREEWKIAEAQAEYQKAVRLWAKEYLRTGAPNVRDALFQRQFGAALLRWYHGDVLGARRDLQSVLESVDKEIFEDSSNTELSVLKVFIQARLADLTLFGGAASGLNSERFENRISLYSAAAKLGTNIPTETLPSTIIRWKQAMLLALNGDVVQAEKLLEDNPLPDTMDVYAVLLRQLAEAVLFYYQSGDGDDRNQKLRIFQRLFSAQNNATPETASQPEILELLLFCQEFLIHDWINHEDWETLAENIYSTSQATANFVRQYPGAIPFMRRFYELQIRSAVLVHENMERDRDKQTQIRNIVRILTQMRPSHSAGMETPTLILFFLPEGTATRPAPGFVVSYPPDGRPGSIYRLTLTRPMVKQPVSDKPFPPLDAQLLEQVATEKAAGRRIRISWNDVAAWSSTESALTDEDYPYSDVLPLQ